MKVSTNLHHIDSRKKRWILKKYPKIIQRQKQPTYKMQQHLNALIIDIAHLLGTIITLKILPKITKRCVEKNQVIRGIADPLPHGRTRAEHKISRVVCRTSPPRSVTRTRFPRVLKETIDSLPKSEGENDLELYE